MGGTHHLGGSMTGIGPSKGERIWFRALTAYMTATSDFGRARAATLQAAADLYGTSGVEHSAVGNAWDLVGVEPTRNLATTLGNPGFEDGDHPWIMSGGAVRDQAAPRSGTYAVVLGGTTAATQGVVYQDVTIPADAVAASLTFWLSVSSTEPTVTSTSDKLSVEVLAPRSPTATLATFTGSGRVARGYQLRGGYSLLKYKGTTIRLIFRETHDWTYPTTFRIDDITISP
jgi:hypothetical protein